MILSTFENDSKTKTANVCKQDNIFVVMFYENEQYLYTQIAGRESEAEEIAEDWVLK